MFTHKDINKQLELDSLIEFSQLINSKLELDFILGNLLLNIMGKMLITRGMFLLHKEDNKYIIANVKGVETLAKGDEVSVDVPKQPVFTSDDIKEENNFLVSNGFVSFYKVFFTSKYLGILCLGNKANNNPTDKHEKIYIETQLNIAAPAIENSLRITQIQQLNKTLTLKVRELETLFELSQNFSTSFFQIDVALKMMKYVLLGTFGIRDFTILTDTAEKGFAIIDQTKDYAFDDSLLSPLFKIERISFLSKDTEWSKKLVEQGFVLILPVQSSNKKKTIFLLGKKIDATPYTQDELSFLQSVANIASISIDNSFLFQEYLKKQQLETEIKFAHEVQKALLPESLPSIEGFDVAGITIPAREIGGDYYDLIKITDDKFAFVIADVCGKGIPASLLMANIQSIVHSYLQIYSEASYDIVEFTEKINRIVCENTATDKFITFLWGILNTKDNSFSYINAGHNPPIMLHQEEIYRLETGGLILGVLKEGIKYESETLTLAKDDIIVFYTDGVTEASDSEGNEFGENRLINLVRLHRNLPAKEILNNITEVIKDFSGDFQTDDITLMVLKKM
ncbi:MAG: PP2C family protein-serine/threonine phosphatase [Ignavibacteria bacterium]